MLPSIASGIAITASTLLRKSSGWPGLSRQTQLKPMPGSPALKRLHQAEAG